MVKAILGPNGKPLVRARYQAAFAQPQHRSTPAWASDTVRKEITPAVRRALVNSSRDLADNSPVIRGLIERMVTYVVGTGIHPFSASKSERFKRQADAYWKRFARRPDIRGGIDWAGLQAQEYRAELRDGDAGHILTSDRNGFPAVYAVEGAQIGEPLTQGLGVFDGVVIDDLGVPLAYQIRSEDSLGARNTTQVNASAFVHKLNPERPGQIRGVPILAAALATARDVQDILSLEKAAVKESSGKTGVFKTASGELNVEDLLAGEIAGQDGESKTRHYREKAGPEDIVLYAGDEYQQLSIDRPGPAWQGFMDFLAQTICLSAKIPPSVLLQIKVGGADTRRDLAAAKRAFELEQLRIANQDRKTWEYVIGRGIDNGDLVNVPDDWREVDWQFPAAITVDAGREAQQDREDVKFGLFTRREYWGRYGYNPDEQEELVVQEAKKRRESIERAGMTVDDFIKIMSLAPSTIQKEQPTPTPEAPDA
jgi:capsid protein